MSVPWGSGRSVEVGSKSQPLMGGELHLCGEDRVGLALLEHSREMKLCLICERPPGPKASPKPSPSRWALLPVASLTQS